MKKLKKETDNGKAAPKLTQTANAFEHVQSIGVMGGTFDPIHYGHLAAAEAVKHELNLDIVLFIPAGAPAFKQNRPVSDGRHRFLMTFLAAASNPCFKVSRIELDRQGITYTIDTVRELKNANPGKKLYFITGADAFSLIKDWRDYEKLFENCNFAVVNRPGNEKKKLYSTINSLPDAFQKKVAVVEGPSLDISSSMIRKYVKDKKPIKYLLPMEVEGYIYENNLYNPISSVTKLEEIISQIKKTQSEKRFAHTMGVAEEAKKLAEHYGADPYKAYLAGLLHDAAKGYTDAKLLEKIKEYKIDDDEVIKRRPNLAHAPVGAKVAEVEFGISDEDVLNAIRHHTTGRPGMSKLEKIVFLADFIEPTRPRHEGIFRVMSHAYVNLDAAVITVLQEKINYNKTRELHPSSRQALDYLLYHYQQNKEDL